MLCTALLAVLALPALDDDLVPAALDALYAAPGTVGITDLPFLLDADEVARLALPATVRCLAATGDVDGDGADDVAFGLSPGSSGRRLQVRSGSTLALLWEADVPGGFRTLRGLSARDGLLASGTSSPGGRVELRRLDSGERLWAVDLAPGARLGNVNAVELVDDRDGDDLPDVLVAAGAGIDAVLLLSSRDGAPLWTSPTPGPALDARPAHDHGGDGLPDVLVAGGEETPFARLLSAADGALVWHVPLDGPGSAVLSLDDVDGDGHRDAAVGQFAAPDPCLLGLSGEDGALLWRASGVFREVTSLRLLADLLDTGLTDVVVGSFDNAVSAVLALNGVSEWRREGSTVNGGAMPAVEVVGDLNLDGVPDVLAASLDGHAYLVGGYRGHFLARLRLGGRAAAVAALDDADGDGRRESLVAGRRGAVVLAGDSGTAGGPVVQVKPPRTLAGDVFFAVWAYPTYGFQLLASTGLGSLAVPGFSGTLGLAPGALVALAGGTAPGAGVSGFNVFGPLSLDLEGVTIHVQAVTFHGDGSGAIGPVTSFVLPGP